MAGDCSDHGMTILQHLFGFSSSEGSDVLQSETGVGAATTTATTFSVCLLSELCEPTSEINKQR